MIYDLQRKIINDDDVLFKDEGLCGWNVDVDVIVDVDVDVDVYGRRRKCSVCNWQCESPEGDRGLLESKNNFAT